MSGPAVDPPRPWWVRKANRGGRVHICPIWHLDHVRALAHRLRIWWLGKRGY